MKHYSLELKLGVALLATSLGFWIWQNPRVRGDRLSAQDSHRYLVTVQNVDLPPPEKTEFVNRLRAWMEADDGRPVYMLNLMRYNSELHRFPDSPEFHGTPQESNAYYESAIAPLLLKKGGYPVFSSEVKDRNLIGYGPDVDNWNRIAIVRYPNRRAFLNLVTDPGYAPYEPYKMMAVQLLLVPSYGEIVLPDATWLVGAGCLFIFLAAGWLTAATRRAR